MAVSNPKEVPEYELNPLELEFRRGEEVTKACFFFIMTLSVYSSYYSVLNVFVLWVLVLQWLPLRFYFHIEAQAKGWFLEFSDLFILNICAACATLCFLYLFVQVYISLKICRQLWQSYLPYNLQGTYLAKWYGSKVFVKILDKDSFSDADSM